MATFKGKVIFNKFITDIVLNTRIEHMEPDACEFQAGQYFTLAIDERTKRAYSISSSPTNSKFFETFVDITPGGPGSKFFENLKEGDEVTYFAPLGRFTYEENDRPALFLATGTGVVPFLSMIGYALETGSKRNLRLLSGFRTQKEMFAEEIHRARSAENSNFSYEIIFSREPNIHGNKGRLTEFLEREISTLGSDIDVYLCGGKDVVMSLDQELERLGVAKERIKYEKFY